MSHVAVPRWTMSVLVLALAISLAFIAGSWQRAAGSSHDTTYYACLYAGSLSQVGTSQPSNCGRGTQISWQSGGAEYIYAESENFQLGPDQFMETFAQCPTGTIAIGGGARLVEVSGLLVNSRAPIESSYPQHTSDFSRWYAIVRNNGPTQNTYNITAVCAFGTYSTP
jgi:hypothetical protein